VAYAAEWNLDDHVLDREEVEAIVTDVASLARVAGEVTCSSRGLHCTFRVPVSAAADVVGALDPKGALLGEDWYRDLDPPLDGDDGYRIRIDLLGPVDGGRCDDEEQLELTLLGAYDDGDDDDERDDDEPRNDDEPRDEEDDDDEADRCFARLRIETLDNREAWPVAFALAAAVVDRLGGDLRDDPDSINGALGSSTEIDQELFELQRHIPRVTGPAVHASGSAPPRPDPIADDDELLN
jgi:hypothetical protein